MKAKKHQLSLPIFIPVLFLINIIVLLLICLVKGQLNIDVLLGYMYYAALVNIVLGVLAIVGNMQSKQENIGAHYNVYPRSTSDEILSKEMKNKSNALLFAVGLEVVGVIMLIFTMIFNK